MTVDGTHLYETARKVLRAPYDVYVKQGHRRWRVSPDGFESVGISAEENLTLDSPAKIGSILRVHVTGLYDLPGSPSLGRAR